MGIELDFNDFSNGHIDTVSAGVPVWEGTGVFDELMKAINGNIQVQYDSGRIKGSEYATVYLGSMQAAISEAMKFMLTKDQIVKDLELKTVQIEATEADTLIKQEQSIKDLELKQAQINIALEDKRLKAAQADAYPLQAVQELALITEQVLTQKEDTKLKEAQAIAYPLQSAKDLEVKEQQILNMQNDEDIKTAQSEKDLELKYVQQIKLDKEAAAMGLDSVVKSMNQNTIPGYIYTPQYKKG